MCFAYFLCITESRKCCTRRCGKGAPHPLREGVFWAEAGKWKNHHEWPEEQAAKVGRRQTNDAQEDQSQTLEAAKEPHEEGLAQPGRLAVPGRHAAGLGHRLARRRVVGAGACGRGSFLYRDAAARDGPARRALARVCHPAGPGWPHLCLARRTVRRADHGGNRLAAPEERGPRNRGQALLSPLRRLAPRHCQRGPDQPARRARAAVRSWRLDDHAADGQASLPWDDLRRGLWHERSGVRGRLPPHDAGPEDQGSRLCDGDGGPVFEGRDPDDLPEPRLSGCRGARLRGRRPALFRDLGERASAGGKRHARRSVGRTDALCADREPATLARPREPDPWPDGGPGPPLAGRNRVRQGQSGGSLARSRSARGRLFRRLGDGPGPVLSDRRHDRRRRGPHDLRSKHPECRRRSAAVCLRHQGQARLGSPGRHRGDERRWRRARHGGRAQVPGRCGPVQPGHPGQAADRLGVQTLRLCRRAGSWLFAQHDGRDEPTCWDVPGSGEWCPENYDDKDSTAP